MTKFDAERLASTLLVARTRRTQTTVRDAPPQVDDAYAAQDAVARRVGAIGGWKVGAKTPIAEPTCAPLFGSLIRPSPASWPAAEFHMIGIEAEVAFRLARDVAPGFGPLGAEEVYAHVASAHPAIEVVDTRLADWRHADPLTLLADNQMNGRFVYGDPVADWRSIDLANIAVRLSIDGKVTVDSVGGNTGGDPLRLLVWLVNHCRERRAGLAAGAIVTTGSFTGMTFVEPGARADAYFPQLGRASVEFPR